MKWNEIGVNTTREAVEAVSHMFHEMGVSGVAIEDPLDMIKERESLFGEIYELSPTHYPQNGVNVKGYFPEDYEVNKAEEHINVFLNKLSSYLDSGTGAITVEEIDETDWSTAWKAYYKPVPVTSNITIVPTWEDYQKKENEKILELDPGMAFGTGTHPTTKLCIRALETLTQYDSTVIDVGCGSGVLSIAAILAGAKSVRAFDLDKVAVSSARTNVSLNGMDQQIKVEQGDLLKATDLKADLVVSNILAEIIVDLVADARKTLKTGGMFITSGIIASKQDMVVDALIESGFVIQTIKELDGWIAICAQKDEV